MKGIFALNIKDMTKRVSLNKKILIISAVFPPEQVTSALMNYDLARELSHYYDVTVLRPYPTRSIGAKFETSNVIAPTFKTILIDSYTHPRSELIGRYKESNDFGRKCAAYIKEHHEEIDFVYNDGWQLFGLYRVAMVCKKYGIPYMVPIQDIYPECLFTNKDYPSIAKFIINSILLPIDKYYQKHAACVRTISKEMRDYLSSTRKVPSENYLVVNNWQNDDDFLKEYPSRQGEKKLVFAYVGSINGHANVDLMIKAFAEADIEDTEFRIYGGGNKKEYCVDLAKQLNAKNIIFDMVSRDKVAYVQSQADVLVLALPMGNGNLCLPSKMVSYMLSGKAVLASVDADSATNRYISESECGYSVPPDSIDAFKEGFLHFSKMKKEEIEVIGNNSRKYSRDYLTRESNLKMVIDRINSILEK